MASIWTYAFAYRLPDETNDDCRVAIARGKAEAHRLRLEKYDQGYDCGGVARIAISLPGTKGASSLVHETLP